MDHVIVASFDPTIFGRNPLSNLKDHVKLPASTIYRDFPRLCTAHLALKVPIVLETSANIRKYKKAGAYPKIEAIYYDPYTRWFNVPTQSRKAKELDEKFSKIANREATDPEMIRFFQRCHNLAKRNLTRIPSHQHQPLAQSIPDEAPEDECEGSPAPTASASSLIDSTTDYDSTPILTPAQRQIEEISARIKEETKREYLSELCYNHAQQVPLDLNQLSKEDLAMIINTRAAIYQEMCDC